MYKWWPFKSKKKDASKMVTRVSKEALDGSTIIISAESELGFWQQENYRELLLTPCETCGPFDIADMIVKAKADRRSKKFRRQAASILHERRCQWQLYEVEIFSNKRVELKYFNYRTENRGTITLDLTHWRTWSVFYINDTESETKYRIDYSSNTSPATFKVLELKDGQSPITFTFEDGKVWRWREYQVAES